MQDDVPIVKVCAIPSQALLGFCLTNNDLILLMSTVDGVA